MKFISQQRREGNTLMITLFFCLAIGLVLASILKLVSVRYSTTMRSTDWNEAVPVLEAGIEEAMTHLHEDGTPSANGWTPVTTGGQLVYTKQRTFADGSYFSVSIYGATTTTPLIYSQGYVRAPFKANQYVARTVQVSATNPAIIFENGLLTSGPISMFGHPLIGGFDSRKGAYDLVTNSSGTGNIATDSTANPAISLGNATINGSASTGPGGTISGGTISGATNNTMNVYLPTNVPPATTNGFLAETSSNIWTASSGSYQISGYNGDPIVVTGNATLWVTGDITIKGGGYIQIKPGASLKLYVSGNVDIGGNGIINGTGLAANFSLIGLAGCTSINYAGTPTFIGTVYAPTADFSMKGTASLYGAVVAKSASLTGTTMLLHDDALPTTGGLIATGWREL